MLHQVFNQGRQPPLICLSNLLADLICHTFYDKHTHLLIHFIYLSPPLYPKNMEHFYLFPYKAKTFDILKTINLSFSVWSLVLLYFCQNNYGLLMLNLDCIDTYTIHDILKH